MRFSFARDSQKEMRGPHRYAAHPAPDKELLVASPVTLDDVEYFYGPVHNRPCPFASVAAGSRYGGAHASPNSSLLAPGYKTYTGLALAVPCAHEFFYQPSFYELR